MAPQQSQLRRLEKKANKIFDTLVILFPLTITLRNHFEHALVHIKVETMHQRIELLDQTQMMRGESNYPCEEPVFT